MSLETSKTLIGSDTVCSCMQKEAELSGGLPLESLSSIFAEDMEASNTWDAAGRPTVQVTSMENMHRLYMCVCIYIYIYVYMYVYIYIYIIRNTVSDFKTENNFRK